MVSILPGRRTHLQQYAGLDPLPYGEAGWRPKRSQLSTIAVLRVVDLAAMVVYRVLRHVADFFC
jgi:hypothetical protein